MKPLICLVLLAGFTASQAAVLSWNSGFSSDGIVPDGNATGWSDTRVVGGAGGSISDINVTLNISGGYNGDLYVFLTHSGSSAVLLNRVGRSESSPFGYSDSGLNVTFNDQASQTIDIHLYRTVAGYSLSGSEWRADGRTIDPRSVVGTDSRSALLSEFNGLSADGEWTLFIADLSGGGTSRIESWGLEITAVPEPVNTALVLFAAIAAGRLLVTRCKRTRAVDR